MTDVMKQLKAADPARRAGLEAAEPATFAALREEIIMTGTQLDAAAAERAASRTPAAAPGARRRRLGRRGAITVALAGVLAGGGAAYAAVQLFAAQDTEGVTCMTTWRESALEGQHVDAAGPWMTGDAIEDCATLLAAQGLPAVADPVVFEHDGHVYVTPAGQAPDWAEPIDSQAGPAVDPRVIELRLSLSDRIDGGRGECRTVDDAATWAQSELDRLGLEDWTIEKLGSNSGEKQCSWLTAEEAGVINVMPQIEPDAVLYSPEVDPVVGALRRGVAGQCLTVDAARALVDEAYGELEHFPTTTVADEAAKCARVDLVVGGSTQVTVYGPTTVG